MRPVRERSILAPDVFQSGATARPDVARPQFALQWARGSDPVVEIKKPRYPMPSSEIARDWSRLVKAQASCRACKTRCAPSLLERGARPLFGRFTPWKNGILFIFEAPNWSDTFDAGKGYLTYDQETDPTGRFARRLMVEELGLSPQYFQVSNSVLCLPRRKNGKSPVSSQQASLCSSLLREQIRVLEPSVVVPVGGRALNSLCHIAPHPVRSLAESVALPVRWYGRWLFPVYHTGLLSRNGPNGRSERSQRRDWRKFRSPDIAGLRNDGFFGLRRQAETEPRAGKR